MLIYIMLVMLPTLVICGLAQWRVKSAFARYSRVRASSGLTGAQAAQAMLRQAGLDRTVGIERVQGYLSDHYDPRHKVLRLSPEIYDGYSLASVGVACHEAGHAIQDARNYMPLILRNAIVPTAGIGSKMGGILMIVGLILSGMNQALGMSLAWVGLILFGSVVVFQLINLPVEFNASSRAKEMLGEMGIIHGPAEAAGVRSMLGAAAMTYVAATVTAILNLIYWAMILTGRRN